MRKIWRTHPYLLGGFALAVLVTVFFATRFVVQTVYWSNPENQNQQVQPWMTVGYVARSWHLDVHEIDALAGLPRPDGHPLTLIEIARVRGVPVAEVVKQVEDAVALLVARRALQ